MTTSRLICECRSGPHGGYTCDYCLGIRPQPRVTPSAATEGD